LVSAGCRAFAACSPPAGWMRLSVTIPGTVGGDPVLRVPS
jgi:hypothetical protein